MTHAPVLHSEWLKIRTLRSLPAALLALFAVTTAFSALAGADGADDPESDPLFTALSGVLPGQIAAVSFGALAMAAEYRGGALRLSLAAVPRRGLWFAAKATAVAVPVLLTGLVTAVRRSARPAPGAALRTASPAQNRRARSSDAPSTSCSWPCSRRA